MSSWRPGASCRFVAFTGLLFFVLPALVFTLTGEGWSPLLDRPRWQLVLIGLVLAPVGAMAVQAVSAFAAHGGTPVPLDPPTELVTSGPYAYVANPMQLGGTILLAAWGVALASPALVAAAAMGAAFSVGLAAWDEDRELSSRFGDDWATYRRQVPRWLPRWRPASAPAVVYVAAGCDPCCEVGRFLAARQPSDLEVRPAERCPFPLDRITYQRGGERESGLAAIGRSLEHVNLGWAAVSWVGRLPGLQQVLQLIADALGFGPRPVVRRTSGTGPEAGAVPGPGS